ncbi:MAG: hypothetical protein ACREOG_14325 [Gemmatimonadaceae bacterium]
MRASSLLFLASIFACASSGAVSEQPVTPQTRGAGLGDGRTMTTTTSSISGELPFPVERVWAILPSVYDSLGVPATDVNASTRIVGNSGLKVRRRLGALPLSRILDCGTTQGGPSAETYEIVMTIRTRLQPAGASATTLATEIEASGRPVSFAGNDVRCMSKTTLEKRIFETVKQRLSTL